MTTFVEISVLDRMNIDWDDPFAGTNFILSRLHIYLLYKLLLIGAAA